MEIALIIVGVALIGVICAVFVNSDNNYQKKPSTKIGNKVGALDSGNFTGSYNKATFATTNYNNQSAQTTSLEDLGDIF